MKTLADSIAFQCSNIAESWGEAFPLLLAHHREVGALPQERFRPDREFYLRLEGAGVLDVYTMRDCGKLVGYASFVVMPEHGHYPGSVWAKQDALYVAPSHRGPVAADFIRWQDEKLRSKYPGVEILRQSTARRDFSGLLEVLGYRQVETAYLLDRKG